MFPGLGEDVAGGAASPAEISRGQWPKEGILELSLRSQKASTLTDGTKMGLG